MSAYFVFNYSVTDPEMYGKYRSQVGPTIGQYGGAVIVATSSDVYEAVEGEPAQVLVVLEFESREKAKAWYDSPEYDAIKQLRVDASAKGGWSALVDAFEIPS